jgi:hypothetical protein
MSDARLIKRLNDLREAKVHPPRDQSVGSAMEALGRELTKNQKGLKGVGEAWDRVCPSEHADRTEVVGIARGVLRVRVEDGATKYELARWLRAGGEREVIEASRHPIRKVKLEG